MRITRACDYAFRAMVYLARSSGQPVETVRVAQEVDVPPVYLRKVLQSLARSGIVKATAGSGGGVVLMRDPAGLTLADIIESVEGPIILSDCIEHSQVCPRSQGCRTKPVLTGIQRAIRQQFAARTLSDIM